MMTRTLPFIAAAFLTGCVTAQQYNDDGSIDAKLGQTVRFGSMKVTPLKVLEDSRCPMEARCIWAGRVRLSVRVTTDAGSAVRELASDKPLQVADGQLTLQGTMPPRSTQRTLVPSDYRLTLKFDGGL